MIAAALLAFTLSIDDYVITFFVQGAGTTTLPLHIYSMIKVSRNMPVINALSTVLLAVLADQAGAQRKRFKRAFPRTYRITRIALALALVVWFVLPWVRGN